MAMQHDRRKWFRRDLSDPHIGILHFCCMIDQKDAGDNGLPSHLFVDVHNLCPTGAMVESAERLTPETRLNFLCLDPTDNRWKVLNARVAWSKATRGRSTFRSGLEYLAEDKRSKEVEDDALGENRPRPEDMEFLLSTKLLDALPRTAVCHLLNCLTRREIPAGKRFIKQGAPGTSMYIIQKGHCHVHVQSGDEEHRVARMGPGDIVGEMAVLTGEPRTASVEAEAGLLVWGIRREDFERMAGDQPDVRIFLTELVTQRFENSPITAERTIGRYVIKGILGKGGWSLVYAGAHKVLGMPVAVKMMKHDMAMEPAFMDTFRKEAEIIAGLNHRNIVKVLDIEELFHTVFIIMEHLEGDSLRYVLDHVGALSMARAADFLYQILVGLDYAHNHGIMHRDIKPGNIFVQSRDRIKILDFGLACECGIEDFDLAGTAQYAAPEQVEGAPVDQRCDLYCLGIMAYEMVVGQRPYPEDDLSRLLDLHVEEDIPDPALALPSMPPELHAFILKCCRRNPNERYADAGEAMGELRPLLARLGLLRVHGESRSRMMSSLVLFYSPEEQNLVNALLEDFGRQVQNHGLGLKIAQFKD